MIYQNEDFIYNSETGELFHARNKGFGKYAGQPCSRKIDDCGRLRVRAYGKSEAQHRVAWFLVHGRWPQKIFFVNGDRTDIRLCNLKEEDQSTICRKSPRRIGRTNHRGITWSTSGNRLYVTIHVKGKRLWLGSYTTLKEAIRVRKEAELEHWGFQVS